MGIQKKSLAGIRLFPIDKKGPALIYRNEIKIMLINELYTHNTKKYSNQLWKSHKNTKHKQKKSAAAWSTQKILFVMNQDLRTSLKYKSFEMAIWSSA